MRAQKLLDPELSPRNEKYSFCTRYCPRLTIAAMNAEFRPWYLEARENKESKVMHKVNITETLFCVAVVNDVLF